MQRAVKYLAIILVLGILASLIPVVPVQAAATLNCDETSGIFNDEITFSGSGYTPDESVKITYSATSLSAGTTVLATTTASSSGSINVDVEVPSAIGGSHAITARNSANTILATTYFTIEPVVIIDEDDEDTAKAGSSITIYGYGFENEESGIQATLENPSGIISNIGSGKTADEKGYWKNTITFSSNLTSGDYTISAEGDDTDSDDVNEAQIEIKAVASLSLSQSSGKAGSQLTVTGSGFAASESNIRVFFGGSQIGNPTTATSSGTWSITVTVPQVAGGSYTVSASGNTTTDAPTQTYSISSGFTLNKTSGPPGTIVTVTGFGYTAGEQGITVTYDGNPIGSPTSAGPGGDWTATFTVPPGIAGNHSVNASGPSTRQTTPATFSVSAGISIDKESGEIGTTVTVSGTGFVAGEKTVALLFDGNPVLSNIVVNPSGAWTANFTIPQVAGGDHIFDAQGATTKATAIGDLTFTVKASVAISKKSGASGSNITVSGAGFGSAEKNIKIFFDEEEAASLAADQKGSFSVQITVPPLASGSHAIKVSGSSTQLPEGSELSFKISAGIEVSPSKGTIGSSVNLNGSGFAPNSVLRISYDDVDLNVGRVTSDSTGSFNKSVTIPKSTSGTHTIKVSDSQNNMGDAEFSIDSAPPSVPKLQSPADGTASGLFGNAAPSFQWQKTTSPSGAPVTYIFQIASDSEFSEPVVEKTDLTNNKYSLTKSEALPGGLYYWRVKAVDAASNSSEWSQAYQIQSGTISPAIFILMIVLIIAILVVVYILFIRRLLAKRKAEREASRLAEMGIPSVVNAEYRIIDQDDPDKKKSLPWRLALPAAPPPPRGGRNLSAEDQARLKNIIDFATSLPLAQPGNDTNWLIELAENETGNTVTPSLYAQLLKGEIQPHYEPAWMRHPTFVDLQTMLEGQSILNDLNSYIDSYNRTASEAMSLLQSIYKDTSAEVSWDILPSGGWGFVSGVYNDSVSWFLGKQLREPSDRNYIIKPEAGNGSNTGTIGLFGEQNTAFKGILVITQDEEDAVALRALHLKLRRSYRSNDKVKEIVSMITQLDVQRTRITNAFNQFNRLNT